LGVAGALIVLGTLVVFSRSSRPSSTEPIAWGGAGALVNSSFNPGAGTSQDFVGVMQQAPYTYVLPTPQGTAEETGTENDGFDFDAFISLLSKGSAKPAPGTQDSSVSNAYAFIPSGLVSVAEPKSRTPLQLSLYNYGNE